MGIIISKINQINKINKINNKEAIIQNEQKNKILKNVIENLEIVKEEKDIIVKEEKDIIVKNKILEKIKEEIKSEYKPTIKNTNTFTFDNKIRAEEYAKSVGMDKANTNMAVIMATMGPQAAAKAMMDDCGGDYAAMRARYG